jgi:hypothetical protein
MGLSGCGVASVHPIVTDADLVNEPRLVGSWQDAEAREWVTITSTGASSYRVVYTDDSGETGEFNGRLGRLGLHRVLDLEPVDPAPNANDIYKSLLLRAHGIVIIDSVGTTLQFRIVQADSLKPYLERNAHAVAHTMLGAHVLLTAPSADVRRFLQEFIGRPGVTETNKWRRRP